MIAGSGLQLCCMLDLEGISVTYIAGGEPADYQRGDCMQEEKNLIRELSESALTVYLRMQNLAALQKHTPGCIVWKGKNKKYAYWQVRKDGRQLQRYIRSENLESVRAQIEKLKQWRKRLCELRTYFRKLKRILRVLGMLWDSVWEKYLQLKKNREEEQARREAAMLVASTKAYSENYRHMTDKGDMVASKSEEIISNTLFAMGVPYEYEKVFTLSNGQKVKPDFTIRKSDGTVFLWEHVGLPEDAAYMEKHEWKMRQYEKCGFTRSKNLILTFDEKGALSASEVRRMIELYHLA